MREYAPPIAHGRPSLDELGLAARIHRGDEAALSTVVKMLWRPLVSYATWLLDDPDAASDVVQECLSHLWLARDRLTINTSFEAYLYRAVRNRALDDRRRVTRRQRLLERLWTRRGPEPGVVPPAGDRLSSILVQALASLPERRRQVFILAHLHDLTYRQIAEILDLSPQTVANHVSRALADLRRKLASHAAALGTFDEAAARRTQGESAG